jgi:hypothetical protein
MIWNIDYFGRCPLCGGFLHEDDTGGEIKETWCNFGEGMAGIMGWWDEGIIEEGDNYDDYQYFLALRQYYTDNPQPDCPYRRTWCDQEGKRAFLRFTPDAPCRLTDIEIRCNSCDTRFTEDNENRKTGLIEFIHPPMEPTP